jgi:hypothetical protein
MAQKFLFGLGGGGGNVLYGSSNGSVNLEESSMILLDGVSGANSVANAKALAVSVLGGASEIAANYDIGWWIGVKWTENLERSYRVGTGNGGATIRDRYDRDRIDWYQVSSNAIEDFLSFQFSETQ